MLLRKIYTTNTYISMSIWFLIWLAWWCVTSFFWCNKMASCIALYFRDALCWASLHLSCILFFFVYFLHTKFSLCLRVKFIAFIRKSVCEYSLCTCKRITLLCFCLPFGVVLFCMCGAANAQPPSEREREMLHHYDNMG